MGTALRHLRPSETSLFLLGPSLPSSPFPLPTFPAVGRTAAQVTLPAAGAPSYHPANTAFAVVLVPLSQPQVCHIFPKLKWLCLAGVHGGAGCGCDEHRAPESGCRTPEQHTQWDQSEQHSGTDLLLLPARVVSSPQNTSCYLNLGPFDFFFSFKPKT